MKKMLILVTLVAIMAMLSGCSGFATESEESSAPSSQIQGAEFVAESEDEPKQDGIAVEKITIEVNSKSFTATLQDNVGAQAFAEMLESGPVTINASDYSGFEKVGDLGSSLPTDSSQMTTSAGDIVLYGSDRIVVFYGSNSWSYTKLAAVDDLDDWADALGDGDAELTFSLG